MQSWVGMLQTLHHHNRTHQPGRTVSLKTPPLRAAGEDGESAGLRQRWGVWLVSLSEVLEHVVYHHSALTCIEHQKTMRKHAQLQPALFFTALFFVSSFT